MKHSTKRLVSVLICLALALSLLPLAVFAEEATTRTLYCQAPDGWTVCNIYWWEAGKPAWPGVAMTQDEQGIWSYDVPADATKVIFNDGTSKSADLDIPAADDDKVMFVFESSTWAPYGKVEVEKAYFVAGDSALCGSNWNPGDPANKMTGDDKGIFTKTFENVAAGDYQLKVTSGSWAASWGGTGEGGNYVIAVTEADSTVEVIFDSVKMEVDVSINGKLLPRDRVIVEENAVFATDDEGNAGKTHDFTPAYDGVLTVVIDDCPDGYLLTVWENNNELMCEFDSAPQTYTVTMTAGKDYKINVTTATMAAGSVSYKIISNSPAQETVIVEGSGDSPDEPMKVDNATGALRAEIKAGKTKWFMVDISDRLAKEDIKSQLLDVSAGLGIAYTVAYGDKTADADDQGYVASFEMVDEDPAKGLYIFSITNKAASDVTFNILVKDRPVYINSAETLKLGDNKVTLIEDYTYTLYEFAPGKTGIYEFTVSEGVIGDWGTASFPADKTAEKTKTLQWTCTDEHQHIMVGIAQTQTADVKIVRTGDYVPPEIMDWEFYETTYDFSKEIPADAKLVKIDVTDAKADVAVLDADGFYRYGSAYGPLMVANLSEAPLDLELGQINGQLRAYVYDANGNLIARNDYNEAIMDYMLAGTTPVTAELGKMLQELGNHLDWWKEGGAIFADNKPSDPKTAWMCFCSYMEGSELTPPSGDSQTGGSQTGGTVTTDRNPSTGDTHLIAAAMAMILSGGALLLFKKKENDI